MATITPVLVSTAGAAVAFAAASAGGDTIATGGNLNQRVVLKVNNASGSSINVTQTGANGTCSYGLAASSHTQVTACAAGAITEIEIVSWAISPTNGNVAITYSATTSVTVAATILN